MQPLLLPNSLLGVVRLDDDAPSGPFDTIMGLPAHPLLVHAAVVLLPLCAMGLVALILIPKWRKGPLDWLVVLGLGVSAVAAFVAKESGEQLAARVGEPKVHAELGDQLPLMAGALFVVGLVWYLLSKRAARREGRSTALVVTSIVAILVVLLNLVWVFRVGHTGAEAVWAGEVTDSEASAAPSATASPTSSGSAATYTLADVRAHNSAADCWTTIDQKVYDLTAWESQHPGGSKDIVRLCGIDGTAAFQGQHGGQAKPGNVLSDYQIGTLGQPGSADASPSTGSPSTSTSTEPSASPSVFSMAQVSAHDSAADCWAAVDGRVYDLTGWASEHPGGSEEILELCGTDATKDFGAQHAGQSEPEATLAGFLVGAVG